MSIQQTAADAFGAVFQAPTNATGWRSFVQSWFGFGDWRLMVGLAGDILVAVLLASTIAFHPRTYGRAKSAADLDHPGALLIYAVIGAVVAQIVAVQPAMAFVVFGIGGLLRFRTNVGEADDTGQVILVTIVGVACGLHLFPLGVLATATGWILLYYLRALRSADVTINGLEADQLEQLSSQVTGVLRDLDLKLVNKSENPRKGRLRVLARGPTAVSDYDIEQALRKALPHAEMSFEWEA